jgi:putative peptide zinc metalloprotease protein
LREWLFGLGDEAPEHFSPDKQRALIAFAWATWVYRLVLFLGIAVLVYHFFIKLVGIFLFFVEIVWFVAKPLWSEISVWLQRWPHIREKARGRKTALGVAGLLMLVLMPWPGRISASALLKPQEAWPVFAPAGAFVQALPFKQGDTVKAGQALAVLYVPDLATRQRALQARLEQERWQAEASAFNEDMRKRWMVAEQSFYTTQAELQGVQTEQKQFSPLAPYDGQFVMADPDLVPGQWVGKKEMLGTLIKRDGGWRVETWLDEDAIATVQVGQTAMFYPDSGVGGVLKLKVSSIDHDASPVLPRRELASVLGGHILTREKNGVFVPERAVYRVALDVSDMTDQLQQHSWRGHLVVHAHWRSPADRFVRQIVSVVVREFGF